MLSANTWPKAQTGTVLPPSWTLINVIERSQKPPTCTVGVTEAMADNATTPSQSIDPQIHLGPGGFVLQPEL